jgi:hypothetical protein
MSLADFSSVMKARAMLNQDTSSIEGHVLQGELKAWEKSIEASYSQEGLAGLASLQMDDLFPIDKQTGKPKVGSRATSKLRVAGMKKGNTNFIVTDANLKLMWQQENLPIPKIDGVKVTMGDSFTSSIDSYTLLDAFNVWLINTKHVTLSSADMLAGKTKKSSYYTYNKSNVEYFGESDARQPKLNPTVNAIRIKQTGHTQTARIMYNFLVACGYHEDYSTFSTNYEIGHIDSQAHMKAHITRAAKNRSASAYSGGLIDKLLQLLKYLDLGSSSLKPRHSGVTAAINKNLQNGRAAMNVEIQPTGFGPKGQKDLISNQGSADLSHALNIVSILKNLGSTASKVDVGEQPIELRTLGASVNAIAKNLNTLYKNYYKNKEAIQITLNNFSKDPKLAQFLLGLESSDSIRTFIKKSVVNSLDPKTAKPVFKANIKGVNILKLDNSLSNKLIQDNKKLTTNVKQQLSKVKALAAKAKTAKSSSDKKPANTGPNFTMPPPHASGINSLIRLQYLINGKLATEIQHNMGTGSSKKVLNYRSGRFADSVKIERMSESRAGMITAFYSYMRNPYGTFAEGGRQESPASRNPKLLIAKSIRELAGAEVANRMRAVLV